MSIWDFVDRHTGIVWFALVAFFVPRLLDGFVRLVYLMAGELPPSGKR